MKCAHCGLEPAISSVDWERERDELVNALQVTACRSQGYKRGWLCTKCADYNKISYKPVKQIMRNIPDWKFQNRTGRNINYEWHPEQVEEPEEIFAEDT